MRDDLLTEIYHRLKFVEKYAEEKFSRKENDPLHRRPHEEKNEGRKRFRSNEDNHESKKE